MINKLDIIFIGCQTILNLYLLLKIWSIEDSKTIINLELKDSKLQRKR